MSEHDHRPDAVHVPPAVLAGIDAVRRSGLVNILDRPRVAELAEEWGLDETARWVRENRGLYARGIFQGFEVEGAEHDPKPDAAADDAPANQRRTAP